MTAFEKWLRWQARKELAASLFRHGLATVAVAALVKLAFL